MINCPGFFCQAQFKRVGMSAQAASLWISVPLEQFTTTEQNHTPALPWASETMVVLPPLPTVTNTKINSRELYLESEVLL